jgi:hypothetical protein
MALALTTGLAILSAIAGGLAGAYRTMTLDAPYQGSTMIGPAIATIGGFAALAPFAIGLCRRGWRSFPVWMTVAWILVPVPATMGSYFLWQTGDSFLHPVWALAGLAALAAAVALFLTNGRNQGAQVPSA